MGREVQRNWQRIIVIVALVSAGMMFVVTRAYYRAVIANVRRDHAVAMRRVIHAQAAAFLD